MLRQGDIFCIEGTPNATWQNRALGLLIKKVSAFRSADNDAKHKHAGIILDDKGTTYEALWRYGSQNFYSAYGGYRVLIGRNVHMTPEGHRSGFKWAGRYRGKLYPVARLLAHATQSTAKIFPMWKPVCSELAGGYLHHAGCDGFEYFKGLTPDNIADRIINWRDFAIIYEGEL